MTTRSERRKARRQSGSQKVLKDAAIITFPEGGLSLDDRIGMLAALKNDPLLSSHREAGTEFWMVQNDDGSASLWVRAFPGQHQVFQVFVAGWVAHIRHFA